MTKPEFYLVRGKVGARLSLVFGQGWDPAVDILTQIQQRYLKPSFIKGTISITAQILLWQLCFKLFGAGLHPSWIHIKTIPHLIGWQLEQDLTLQKTAVVSAKVPYIRRFSNPNVESSWSQAPMMPGQHWLCLWTNVVVKCSASLLSVFEPSAEFKLRSKAMQINSSQFKQIYAVQILRNH